MKERNAPLTVVNSFNDIICMHAKSGQNLQHWEPAPIGLSAASVQSPERPDNRSQHKY